MARSGPRAARSVGEVICWILADREHSDHPTYSGPRTHTQSDASSAMMKECHLGEHFA